MDKISFGRNTYYLVERAVDTLGAINDELKRLNENLEEKAEQEEA